jgi:hypothetical protein
VSTFIGAIQSIRLEIPHGKLYGGKNDECNELCATLLINGHFKKVVMSTPAQRDQYYFYLESVKECAPHRNSYNIFKETQKCLVKEKFDKSQTDYLYRIHEIHEPKEYSGNHVSYYTLKFATLAVTDYRDGMNEVIYRETGAVLKTFRVPLIIKPLWQILEPAFVSFKPFFIGNFFIKNTSRHGVFAYKDLPRINDRLFGARDKSK